MALVLFGATGFTGKLALEWMLEKRHEPVCVCARSAAKAQKAIGEVKQRLKARGVDRDDVQVHVDTADLAADTEEKEDALRAVVKKYRVCLSTAGPFERHGLKLVKICAEVGTHYADITGESDFVRKTVEMHDATARASGAIIVSHCGNDCIPWDLSVYEMHRHASSRNAELVKVDTFVEMAPGTAASGGTVSTAVFQLNKKRKDRTSTTDFDPLLRTPEGTKSPYSTTNKSSKSSRYVKEFQRNGSAWIMTPVMANCIRRSNALLGYQQELHFSDTLLRNPSFLDWISDKAYESLVAASILAPALFRRFLPAQGEGPSREFMDKGWLKVHARGVMKDKATGAETALESTYEFFEDVGYLATAKFLVEAGRLLLESDGQPGGVLPPAVAFGSRIVERLAAQTGAKFTLAEAAA